MIATRPWLSTDRRRVIETEPAVECSGLVAAHDAVDPRRYVIGVNRRRVTACRGCLGVIESLIDVIPDRRS